MQKPVLIVEHCTEKLQSINENTSSSSEFLLGGPFTMFGERNRNERIYTADKFLPALQEFNERLSTLGVVFGSLDHPEAFEIELQNASHAVTKAFYVKESNRVDGQIKLLSTTPGREARAIINDGFPLFVSSRAAGITEGNGNVAIKKLFTYDIVGDPGFASARMSNINESCGFNNDDKTNFRIFEMSNESKINDLFNMNRNDLVTKRDMTQYSKYLINEIASTKNAVKTAIKNGSMNPKKLEELLSYYEELQTQNEKMSKYLDYLAEQVQIVVDKTKDIENMKSVQEKLISHNDYLAEQLEKGIQYTEYIGENVESAITYSEYIAEQLDKNIEYTEYIGENVESAINYSEYIAEQLDKGIDYTEYVAEQLDNNIDYVEYVAEHVDNNIQYSEYISEHVQGNIAYTEYIAEHLDDNIAYSEYIAENLDKSVSYTGDIVSKLNDNKIFENKKDIKLPSPEESGFSSITEDYEEYEEEEETYEDEDSEEGTPVKEYGDEEENPSETETPEYERTGSMEEEQESFIESKTSDSELSKQIDTLIEEARKRKVSETSDLHFLKFLNKGQVDSFYGLTNEEQEQVKLHLNEKKYYSSSDVIRLITEALAVKNETLEERLIRMMPEQIKPIWNQLNESQMKSILSQGRLYPNLELDNNVEHFWLTRNLKKNESVSKQLVSHEAIIQEDKLSDKDFTAIMERLHRLK